MIKRQELLRLVQKEKARRECEGSLSKFAEHAWSVVEPGVPFVPGWHIDRICEHLEAVSRGEIKRLLINVPPRHMKSLLVAVFWPCWEWTQRPWEKYLYSSYSGILSTRDSVKCRRLITSPWYQSLWGDKFKLSGDSNQKMSFENDKTGYRVATSVGGTSTGLGASRLVCLPFSAKVRCRSGEKQIGEVTPCDEILAFDHNSNSPVWGRVLELEKTEGRESLTVTTATGASLTMTDDHPVYVVGRGYLQAKVIKIGDRVLKSTVEEDTVIKIEPAPTPEFVYNVAVDIHHNYFADSILVHNCDDPHGAQDAQSDAMRETALEWFDSVWQTRLNNPKEDVMVTIMQRLHEKDVSGRILELGGWEHLCLPAEYDGVKRSTSFGGFYDPRKEDGELLWPDRFGQAELDRLKQSLGEYGVSGQLQQRPTPSGGGLLKPEWFQLWPKDQPLPQFSYILQSYDTAFTERTQGDPTACTVWGVFFKDSNYHVMLLDCWAEHLAYPDLRERVLSDWNAKYAGDPTDIQNSPRRADLMLIEEKGSGMSLLQDLRRARVPVASYNPGRADKVSRAHIVAPVLESGIVWVRESKKGNMWVSWAESFMQQLSHFPRGEHDDFVDTMTQALRYLRDRGFLGLPETNRVYDDIDKPVRKNAKVNPYAI